MAVLAEVQASLDALSPWGQGILPRHFLPGNVQTAKVSKPKKKKKRGIEN